MPRGKGKPEQRVRVLLFGPAVTSRITPTLRGSRQAKGASPQARRWGVIEPLNGVRLVRDLSFCH